MRTELIPAIAIFLAMALAVSAVETAFDGWLYSGQSITVEGRTFLIYKGSGTQDITADFGKGSLFIVNNSCQQDADVRICLDNIEYYIDAKAYRMKVRAVSLEPKISITRTAADEEFEAGLGTRISVSVSNTGGLAQDVIYTDTFPEGVVVESVEGAMKEGNGVRWEKRSLKSETGSFSYEIKVKDVIQRSFAASLSYSDGRQRKTITTTPISIKTTVPLLNEMLLGFSSTLLGETNNMTLNFTNREPLTANITADLYFEEGLAFTKVPSEFKLKKPGHFNANVLMEKTNATLNKSKAYYFEFEGRKTGTFNIEAAASYSTRDVKARELSALKKSVKITDKGIKVRANLDDMEMESGQERTIRMWLQNLNPAISVKDILLKMDGGGLIGLPDQFIKTLAPYEHAKVVETDFFAPNVSSTSGYTVKVNATYFTEFGENFSKQFTFTETVNRIEEAALTKTSDKVSLESGEEATILVKIKNPRKTRLNLVSVSEQVPEEFSVFGSTSALMSLASGDEQAAYTYVIKAPRSGREITYRINTTASYSDRNAGHEFESPKDYEISKGIDITVKPQKFELTATRSVEGDILLGNVFDVTYKLKNPSADSTAKTIQVTLPLQDELDLVGVDRVVSLESLAPKEEVSLFGKVKMRAKKAGTHNMGEAQVNYENDFGEKFEVNITSTSVKVGDRSTSDTFIFVTKNVSAQANNTDDFTVTLSVLNVGASIASVQLEDADGSLVKDFAVSNGSTAQFSYAMRIEAIGIHKLEAATATYSFGGRKLLTASDTPSIQIVSNPVLQLSKEAPVSAYVGEEFEVVLSVKPLVSGVSNVTVNDKEEFTYSSLPSAKELRYKVSFAEPGIQTLAAATASYNFRGASYTASSSAVSVSVIEEEFLTLNKTVSQSSAKPDEKVDVEMQITNKANDELEVAIEDAYETWTVKLAPGESKSLIHKVKASEIGAATAYFNYKDRKRTSKSNVPELELLGEDGKVLKDENKVEKIKDEKGEGILGKVLGFMKSVLTWKR